MIYDKAPWFSLGYVKFEIYLSRQTKQTVAFKNLELKGEVCAGDMKQLYMECSAYRVFKITQHG